MYALAQTVGFLGTCRFPLCVRFSDRCDPCVHAADAADRECRRTWKGSWTQARGVL